MVSGCEVQLTVQTRHEPTGELAINDGAEYVLRRWSCVVLDGRPRAANATQLPHVREVEFVLHETFANNHQVVRRAPFRVEEEGWGEFDMTVLVHFAHCTAPLRITHDLNFQEGSVYEKKYRLTVPNPSPGFLALYNRPSTHARKTLPARQTKARKGPPRSAQYSPSAQRRRSPSASPSDYDSDDSSLSSGSPSDGGSDGRRPASMSSASAGRRHTAAVRRQDAMERPVHSIERPLHKTARAALPATTDDDRRQRAPAASGLSRLRKDPAARPAVRRAVGDAMGGAAPPARTQPTTSKSPTRGLLVATQARTDRAAATAVGSTGIASQQRRRRISDTARPASRSPTDTRPIVVVETSAAKRPSGIGISGVRVPKKRTTRPADERGEKRTAPEHDPGAKDDGALRPAKRYHLAVPGGAAEQRRALSPLPVSTAPPTSSSSSSISPPPAVSSREAFIRERERQRHLDPSRDAGGAGHKAAAAPAAAPAMAQAPAPAVAPAAVPGLGLLGKTARTGLAVARVRRDIAEIAVPKHTVGAVKPGRARRRDKGSSASGSQDGDSDDGSRRAAGPAGMAVSPELAHRMTEIMERASQLGEQAIVGFLRLLHTLRVEQEPENAAAITAEAVGQVQTAGSYSCNFSTLAPEAIDRLWAFVA